MNSAGPRIRHARESTSEKGGLLLVLTAAIVGAFVGLVASAFHVLLDAAENLRGFLHSYLEPDPLPGWVVTAPICVILTTVAVWLVRRFAPEAAGSGIQEIEGVLADERVMRWKRILPIKFVAGLLSIGSGMVLGREGPTIHLGGALGAAISDWWRLPSEHTKSLIAAGSGAGLAAAFNAPLAAIIFVTEELRLVFNYNVTSLQSVIAACVTAVIVNDWWLNQGPFLPVHDVHLAPLTEAPLYLLLGLIIGVIGTGFNVLIIGTVRVFGAIRRHHWLLLSVTIGGTIGAILWFFPQSVGGGESLIAMLIPWHLPLTMLFGLFLLRSLTTALSYGAGVPGGIFAPMLALGTLAGVLFGVLAKILMPDLLSTPAAFAVAAMGALFAATVGAPLTGIVLVIELTGANEAMLTVIVTCLSATLMSRALGGRPLYSELLNLAMRSDSVATPLKK